MSSVGWFITLAILLWMVFVTSFVSTCFQALVMIMCESSGAAQARGTLQDLSCPQTCARLAVLPCALPTVSCSGCSSSRAFSGSECHLFKPSALPYRRITLLSACCLEESYLWGLGITIATAEAGYWARISAWGMFGDVWVFFCLLYFDAFIREHAYTVFFLPQESWFWYGSITPAAF